MARRLAALLGFWDVLQGPRYAFWFERKDTLEELIEDIYGMTLKAWCPGSPASVREHLALTVERIAALSPKDFENLSSAYRYAVNGPLCAWDRELGRH